MTGQSLGSLPLSMYKVIVAYKPEDTTIAKVLLYLRKSRGAIAHPAPLVPTPLQVPEASKSSSLNPIDRGVSRNVLGRCLNTGAR